MTAAVWFYKIKESILKLFMNEKKSFFGYFVKKKKKTAQQLAISNVLKKKIKSCECACLLDCPLVGLPLDRV